MKPARKPKPRKPRSEWPAKLQALQVKLDLAPPQMAERLGVSFNTYRSWLYDRRIPSGPAAKLIDLLIAESKKK